MKILYRSKLKGLINGTFDELRVIQDENHEYNDESELRLYNTGAPDDDDMFLHVCTVCGAQPLSGGFLFDAIVDRCEKLAGGS